MYYYHMEDYMGNYHQGWQTETFQNVGEGANV